MDKNFEKLVTTMSVFTETLIPLTESPFKVVDDNAMKDLTESIKRFGVLEPITVRKPDDTKNAKFEIISGYRRFEACKQLGIPSVSVRILDLSRDDAIIAMIDSNLCHRENILPSEKAAAYKMKLDAMKRQGYRTDLETGTTSTQPVSKLRSNELVGEENNESRETVRRYIRLNNLIPEILNLVDEGKIAFTPAVELSYLTKEQQHALLNSIEEEEKTPSFSQAVRMKKTSQEGSLTNDVIRYIMFEEKANQKEMFRIPLERIQRFVPKANKQQMEDFVLKACEHYYKMLQRRKDRDAR